MELHQELERRLAAFKHAEAVADVPVAASPPTRRRSRPSPAKDDLIVTDELNHASIIDGVRLSKAARAVYPHKDVDGLERVLRDAARKGGPDGAYEHILSSPTASSRWTATSRRCPASATSAERYDAIVMVDDAHASGVLGRNGRGTVDHFGLHGRVDIQVGTLSKAIGVLGGYIAGTQAPASTYSDPAARPVPVLHLRIRRRSSRPASPRSTSSRTSRSASTGCGRTPASSRTGCTRWASTPASRDADHAGHRRRPEHGAGSSARGCSRRASSPRPSSSPRSPRHGAGSAPSSSAEHTRDDLQACLDAFATAGRELRLIGG